MNNLFGDGTSDWKFSTIKNRAMTLSDPDAISATLLCNAAHTYYQIHNFVTNLDKVMTHEYQVYDKDDDPNINRLLGVKNEEDMIRWVDDCRSSIKSKRINRNEDIISVEGFFV
jgi:hypothetical protein